MTGRLISILIIFDKKKDYSVMQILFNLQVLIEQKQQFQVYIFKFYMSHLLKQQHLQSTQSQIQAKSNQQTINKFSKSTNFAFTQPKKHQFTRKKCYSAKIREGQSQQKYEMQRKSYTVKQMRKPSTKKSVIKVSISKNENAIAQGQSNQIDKKQNFMNILRNEILKTKVNIKCVTRLVTYDQKRSISELEKQKDDSHFHYEVDSKINYNKIKTLGTQPLSIQKDLARSKSRIVNRSLIKQLDREPKQREQSGDLSQFQQKDHIPTSLGVTRNESPKLIKIASQFVKYYPRQLNIVNDDEDSSSQKSIYIANTEIYQCQINKLTNNFLKEYEGMNIQKQNTYKHLRNKLIAKFPSMKKKYPDYDEANQSLILSKRNSSFDYPNSPKRRQSKLFSEEGKDSERKGSINQQRLLQQIYKQAYFWSRTKGKKMSIKFADLDEHRREMQNLQRMKKSLTFMKYIKNKSSKRAIMQKTKHLKGKNIMKKHEDILKIEKQGSKQHQLLQKCLDRVIDSCIRSTM